MTDNSSDQEDSPNIEWRRVGFEEQERVTLKTNVKQAIAYEAKKENNLNAKPIKASDLPVGLKKIKNKINSFDDDDDENDYQIVRDPLLDMQNNNSLYAALNEDEKKFLKQTETNETMRQQRHTENLTAMNKANDMAKKAGFKGLKKQTYNQSWNETAITTKKTAQTLKLDVNKDLKKKFNKAQKSWDKMSDKELLLMMGGINKIKEIGGVESQKALKNMEMKEIVEAGKEKNDDKKIARTICEKTGRKVLKKKPTKENINKQNTIEKKMIDNKAKNQKIVQQSRER